MDVQVLCSLDVLIYILMSSFFNMIASASVHGFQQPSDGSSVFKWLVFAWHGSFASIDGIAGLHQCPFTQRVNNLVAMYWLWLAESVTKGRHLGIPSGLPG